MADPVATPEIFAYLQRNVELRQWRLRAAAEANAALAGTVSQDEMALLELDLNDAALRLEWAKQGVPL